MIIEKKYKDLCNKPSDIHEHLPTLCQYAEKVDHITEMGVRWIVSTWALLAGNPKKLISIDIKHPNQFGGNLSEVENAAKEKNIEFYFIENSTLNIEIEETELLFIDTLHTYTQLIQELNLHHNKVKKYIILHDTTTFGYKDEQKEDSFKVGLKTAISEFLSKNENWEIHKEFTNNNGLTILMRK